MNRNTVILNPLLHPWTCTCPFFHHKYLLLHAVNSVLEMDIFISDNLRIYPAQCTTNTGGAQSTSIPRVPQCLSPRPNWIGTHSLTRSWVCPPPLGRLEKKPSVKMWGYMYLDPHTIKAKRRLTIPVNNPCGFYMQGLIAFLLPDFRPSLLPPH